MWIKTTLGQLINLDHVNTLDIHTGPTLDRDFEAHIRAYTGVIVEEEDFVVLYCGNKSECADKMGEIENALESSGVNVLNMGGDDTPLPQDPPAKERTD